MSIRGALDTAIYAKLNVSSVTTLATGGVHNQSIPESVGDSPAVVFDMMTESIDQGSDSEHYENVYLVKAVVRENYPNLASDIDAACKTILNNTSLTISGWTHLRTLRESAAPPSEEMESGETWQHIGGLYRIWSVRPGYA